MSAQETLFNNSRDLVREVDDRNLCKPGATSDNALALVAYGVLAGLPRNKNIARKSKKDFSSAGQDVTGAPEST
jgi:hypothetical protein